MAGSWRPLPEDLAEPVRWLVRELRVLKDRSQLSLARLELKTNYSKSSWERWLNGKQLPPRDAVIRFAETCGGDRALLTQLWDRAAASRSSFSPSPSPSPSLPLPVPALATNEAPERASSAGGEAPKSAPDHGWPRRWLAVLAIVALGAVAATVGALMNDDSNPTDTAEGEATVLRARDAELNPKMGTSSIIEYRVTKQPTNGNRLFLVCVFIGSGLNHLYYAKAEIAGVGLGEAPAKWGGLQAQSPNVIGTTRWCFIATADAGAAKELRRLMYLDQHGVLRDESGHDLNLQRTSLPPGASPIGTSVPVTILRIAGSSTPRPFSSPAAARSPRSGQ